MPSRITAPPAQRNPSPNTVPAPPFVCVVPWKKSTLPLSGAPDIESTSESAAMLAVPFARNLPNFRPELRQPTGPVLGLLHGHAVPEPSPKQYDAPGSGV